MYPEGLNILGGDGCLALPETEATGVLGRRPLAQDDD